MRGASPYHRYGIYFAPPKDDPLTRFAARWLGWDPESAAEVPRLELTGLPGPVEALTAAPARYGFHATLKAPFRMKPDLSLAALAMAVQDFCEDAGVVVAPPLQLTTDLGFVALRPSAPSAALDALAGEIVESFDAFRAPLSEAELARRRSVGLTPEQDAHLARWGYPFVFDAFRFHMTLSSRLDPAVAQRVADVLAPQLAPLIDRPLELRELCIFGDPGLAPGGAPRHFKLLRRFRLTG